MTVPLFIELNRIERYLCHNIMKKRRVIILTLIIILLFSNFAYAAKEKKIVRRPRVVPPIVLKKGVYISSGYGYRVHPITKRWGMHRGVDVAAPVGTRVYAIADGQVTMARRNGSAGNEIRIKHANGIESRYFHMHNRTVKVGDKVRAGQLIGTVGDTGRVTGPHLHFELRIGGKSVNPTKLIKGGIKK